MNSCANLGSIPKLSPCTYASIRTSEELSDPQPFRPYTFQLSGIIHSKHQNSYCLCVWPLVPCTGLKMMLFNHKLNLKVRQGSPCLEARVGKLKKRAKKKKKGFAYVLTKVWKAVQVGFGTRHSGSRPTFLFLPQRNFHGCHCVVLASRRKYGRQAQKTIWMNLLNGSFIL